MNGTFRRMTGLTLGALWAVQAFALSATIIPEQYLDDVKFLASKNMKGRASGSPELEKAAAYIARRFREFGLQPIDKKSYLQAFQVTTNAKLGSANRFESSLPSKNRALRF